MTHSDISNTISNNLSISNLYEKESKEDIMAEMITGLTAKEKYISSKFFYDDTGSMLFEQITGLPEYYPARTEKSILKRAASGIMGTKKDIDIIELGSGDCSKISILLDAIPLSDLHEIRYIPVDVSEAAIMKSADILTKKYPTLKIHGFLADFMKHLGMLPGKNGKRLICFFGSTLGNLTRKQGKNFLLHLKNIMHPGDQLLLGLDRVKGTKILEGAYNDEQGVTADFNKNILHVVNNHLATNFDPRFFEHLAFYNTQKARIETYLKALQDITMSSSLFPGQIILEAGETIHTEYSHKFDHDHIVQLAAVSGLQIKEIFSDDNPYFSVIHFEKPNLA